MFCDFAMGGAMAPPLNPPLFQTDTAAERITDIV